MMIKGKKQALESKGFLTIELLFTSTILLFILVSLIPLFVLAVRENAASRDMTQAWSMAMDKWEELNYTPFDSLPTGTHTDQVYIKNVKFTRSWSVLAGSPLPEMKTITVEVFTTVKRGVGKPRRARLTTYRIPKYPF
jgi:hypothetical protein